MNILARKFVNIALLIAVLFVFMPRSAGAQVAGQFGGLASFVIPCTCSLSISIGFTPLWLGNIPTVGLLSYTPGASILHQGYLIGVPGAWHLGQYAPGAQACFVVTPVGCVPIPNIGAITRTGTSVPGPF